MLKKINWMHKNDQREIDFLETYRFLSNFTIKNDRFKRSGWSKWDKKISKKIKQARQVKLRES